MTVEDIQAERQKFLSALYYVTGADKNKGCNRFELGEELGFDESKTSTIVAYLVAEGLLKSTSIGPDHRIEITNYGINQGGGCPG